MERFQTITDHLTELRRRLIAALAAFGAGTCVSLFFVSDLIKILKRPAAGIIDRLVFFGPEEAFAIYMRVGLIAGLVLSMPVLLYEAWAFLAPALDERWRRGAVAFVFFCFLTFLIGGFFAYSILIPPALHFLLTFAREGLEPLISAQKYISFVAGFLLACGLVFEMPIVSFMLARMGIISAAALRKRYKYAVVVIFVVAAIITPTVDVFNLVIMAAPMILLYEVSIWTAYLARSRSQRAS